ncbi:hypothetical protein, partial [Corynebacterium auriscanis]|uniref:hypothetical protein n=1 Tax=Corynebacterium auriscanis TaxID=99807 RepID=UPI0024AC9C8D
YSLTSTHPKMLHSPPDPSIFWRGHGLDLGIEICVLVDAASVAEQGRPQRGADLTRRPLPTH